MRFYLGRYVYGVAAIGFGICALAWHDFNIWQQIRPLGNVSHPELLLYAVAVVEILGGLTILWPGTAPIGAIALGALYLFFAVLWLPLFVENPRIFDRLDNFFEQFSLVSGALIVYASTLSPKDSARAARLARVGYYCFAICVVAFTVEQVVYLSGTADFVPKWIPPGQMFWAEMTTIAFAFAAIALLSGLLALLAARLLTAMIVGFGVLVWLPAMFADRQSLTNWGGNAENLAIAGAAWIVADYLSQTIATPKPTRSLPRN
jgi:uncharacterized membrane protein YphA (DoxX/SURF4 family)